MSRDEATVELTLTVEGETFDVWMARITAAHPDCHVTYGTGDQGVNWAEAWEEDRKVTIATWRRAE